MRVVASVPVKAKSQRVVGKNLRPLAGKPLCTYIMDAAVEAGLDVYVNTDAAEAADLARSRGCSVIDRPAWLSADTSNGNDLLVYDAEQVEADVYVQLFATAPFLRAETIRRAVELLKENPEADSVFTVHHLYTWAWFGDQPVNYDPRTLPRSQDARPITLETTGLYAIRREALLERRCRIGAKPLMLPVDVREAIDIDTEDDWAYAEFVMQRSGK